MFEAGFITSIAAIVEFADLKTAVPSDGTASVYLQSCILSVRSL